jgi:hypothetical protein
MVDARLRQLAKEIDAAFDRKLHILMKHYSIDDPQGWRDLAVALAKDFVPGFRVDQTLGFENGQNSGRVVFLSDENIGRRNIWTVDRLDELLEAVEKTKKRFGMSTDLAALKHLTGRDDRWLPSPRGDRSKWIRTLQSRLAEAKFNKRNTDTLRKMLQEIGEKFRKL